jgi:hypothetical protein
MGEQNFPNPFDIEARQIIAFDGADATLAVGTTSPTSNGEDMFFFGLDTNGMFYYGPCSGAGLSFGGNGPDHGNDLLLTSDGGLILVGDRTSGTGYTSVFVVKMMDDCVGTGSVINDTIQVTGLTEENFDLKVYPNPTRDYYNIETIEQSKFQLFSSDGKLISSQFVQAGTNRIDSPKNSGVYWIRVTSAKGSSVVKLIRE